MVLLAGSLSNKTMFRGDTYCITHIRIKANCCINAFNRLNYTVYHIFHPISHTFFIQKWGEKSLCLLGQIFSAARLLKLSSAEHHRMLQPNSAKKRRMLEPRATEFRQVPLNAGAVCHCPVMEEASADDITNEQV